MDSHAGGGAFAVPRGTARRTERGARVAPFLHWIVDMHGRMQGQRTNPGYGHALGGGVAAGVIGGAVIALAMLVTALVRGADIWIGVKAAAAPFLGERALRPGFDAEAVAFGMACHFAVSIVWGVLFSALFYGMSRGATVVAGALWGLVVWFVMYYVVLPLAGLEQMASQAPAGPSILLHVLFGLAVGIGFLPFQRPRPELPGPITGAPVLS